VPQTSEDSIVANGGRPGPPFIQKIRVFCACAILCVAKVTCVIISKSRDIDMMIDRHVTWYFLQLLINCVISGDD